MEPDITSLEDLLTINEEQLTKEWANQPNLYMRCARLSARAAAAVSEAKLALTVWSAAMDKAVRGKAHAEGTKITEAGVDASIKMDAEYQRLNTVLHAAQERDDILRGLCRAFEMRERSLKYLSIFLGDGGTTAEDGMTAAQAAARASNARLRLAAGADD